MIGHAICHNGAEVTILLAPSFLNDRHPGDLVPVLAQAAPQVLQEAPVDVVDDLHVAGQQPLHQADWPLLQSLWQHCVVGEGKYLKRMGKLRSYGSTDQPGFLSSNRNRQMTQLFCCRNRAMRLSHATSRTVCQSVVQVHVNADHYVHDHHVGHLPCCGDLCSKHHAASDGQDHTLVTISHDLVQPMLCSSMRTLMSSGTPIVG